MTHQQGGAVEETGPDGDVEGPSQLPSMVGEVFLKERSSAAVDGICAEEEQGAAERSPGAASDGASALMDSLDMKMMSRRHADEPIIDEAVPITSVFEHDVMAATRHDDVDGNGGGGDDAAEDEPVQLQEISLIL